MVKVTAAGTLWVRPEHVGSMATTTTDDILMVYGDGADRRLRDAADLCVEPAGLARSWNARRSHSVHVRECDERIKE